ncbi:hypothetical protein EMPS_03663 [Entomortierella parvispora]|uniref:Uncharacterized protein n=1 Tax=Entomortierella parvispora TaxID=205924 RepID=A0A9P3H777_9FUNG|nr:hypothetical protein EMPS_03663 [Entomortierella parvispora]
MEIIRKEYEMVDELNKIMAQLAGSHDVQRVKPWVCLKLVHLETSIEFPSGHKLVDWDEQVFQQISKLNHLEYLDIGRPSSVRGHKDGVRGLQLKVRYGMGLLALIKDLHTLHFVDTCQRMDEQDLLWILHQWPNLKSMTRSLHEDEGIRRTLRRLALETAPKLKFSSNKFHDWDWDNDDALDEE